MGFITFRRYYLDYYLNLTNFSGKVLDVGGKKDNKRGEFRPQLDNVESWEYLNIDSDSKPDYLCSAEDIPVEDNTFDYIILTDVLEHLENPIDVLKECKRVLKANGTIVITMPFLNGVHADPYDFQRWTDIKHKRELELLKFENIDIKPMGGKVSVIFDIILHSSHKRNIISKVANKVIRITSSLLLKIDKPSRFITTGYFISAVKF
jgi:SAM-dependent methyltransferase